MLNNEKANTGPKTSEGKRVSSLNALKHGLTAVSPQAQEKIARELECNYEERHASMRECFKPTDSLEDELVLRLTDCLVRLKRCRVLEQALLSRSNEATRPTKSLHTIQKYERIADLQLHRTIASIARKREMDRKNSKST